jgi:hypothetical protein
MEHAVTTLRDGARKHLVGIAVLAALHVTTFARSLFRTPYGALYTYVPWDFDQGYHRLLVYVGDSLRHGIVPLWHPYVAGGTAFFINPQNQLWAPTTLVIGTLLGYTHDIAQYQDIFTILFGGVGTYVLAYSLFTSRRAAFIAALCYNFSSAVFSNAEHLDIVTAAALQPWLFWATERAVAGRRWAFPLLAFLVYWLITGGYPGMAGMELIWLAAWFVYLVLKTCTGRREQMTVLARGASACAAGLGLSAVLWIPVIAHRGEFTRGAPLTVDVALSTNGSLNFRNLWGILFHFLTVTGTGGADPDISMRGVYIGAIALPLVLLALLYSRIRYLPALAFAAGAGMLMSLGRQFFARLGLHVAVPVFNFSRFPSADSRSLMALALALLAGAGAALLEGQPELRRKLVAFTAGIIGFLLVGLLLLKLTFFADMPASQFNDRAMPWTTAEIIFAGGICIALWRLREPRQLLAALAVALALDVCTGVCANYFVVGTEITPAEYAQRQNEYRHTFDAELANVPRLATGTKYYDPNAAKAFTSKLFYLSDYPAFKLRRFDALIAGGFGPWMTTGKRVAALPRGSRPDSFAAMEPLLQAVPYTIELYHPNRVDYSVDLAKPSLLVLNEVYFPGWRASVDGIETPVQEVAGGLRALDVPAGRHTIRTYFRPTSFVVGASFSALSAIILAAWAWASLRRARREHALQPAH